MLPQAISDLSLIRSRNPIIHNVTNFVVMQTTANVLLAIGASPIMAHAKEELIDIVNIANALVINIGTLDENWVQAFDLAQTQARKRKIPIVFDPVGAGASHYRTIVAKRIINNGVDIIRGNPSEIMALVNEEHKAKGVDATHESNAAIDSAKILANEYHCTVVISGESDVIVDSTRITYNKHGTPLFTKVTGTGCAATAMIAAFAAVNSDYFNAASHAMMIYTKAGESAATLAQGPGSFSHKLIDILFHFEEYDHVSK